MTLEQLADILTAAAEALQEMEQDGPASTDLVVAAMHVDLAARHLQAHIDGARGKTLLEVFAEERVE